MCVTIPWAITLVISCINVAGSLGASNSNPTLGASRAVLTLLRVQGLRPGQELYKTQPSLSEIRDQNVIWQTNPRARARALSWRFFVSLHFCCPDSISYAKEMTVAADA